MEVNVKGKPCIIDYKVVDDDKDNFVIEKVVYKCGCEAVGNLVAPHCPIHGNQVNTESSKKRKVT